MAANCAEFRFTMDLRSRTADGLHSSFIGDKLKNGTRNFSRDAIQKIQRELNAFRGMVCHKAAGKEFGSRAARREGELLIALPLRQHINSRERSGIRQSNPCVSMPRRAVHPDLAFMGAQNDAVVAEDSHAGAIDPQTGGGALSRTRMAEEKMPAAVFVRNPNGVHFHAFPARKAMNHEQFVKRILKRVDRAIRVKVSARQQHAPGAKIGIEPRFLVRSHPQERREKAESISARLGKERPQPAGVK